MGHRSRLAGFIIDSQQGDLLDGARFWAQALGVGIADPDENGLGLYARLDEGPGGLYMEVQKVEHPSRVHLDIETDDIEAEVKRLEKLGATRIAWVRDSWWVMQAPTGHRFCVVPMVHPDRGATPTTWD